MPLRNSSQLGVGKGESLTDKETPFPNQKEQFDEEDETEEKWLQSLGVEESEIRKIQNLQVLIF